MKNKINNIFAVSILTAAVILAGCFSPLQPSSSQDEKPVPAGMGMVTLSLAKAASRTVFPDKMENFAYTVICTAVAESPVTDVLTDGGVSIMLKTGISWTITVNALFADAPVGQAVINNVQLTEGEIKKINNVYMLPIPGGASGRLVYAMDFPADVASAFLYCTDVNGDPVTDSGGSPVNAINLKTSGGGGNISLKPGFYLISAVLEKNNKKAGNAEVAHIYPNLDNTITWTFSENSFLPTVDVPVTVTISHSADVVIDSMELRSDDYSFVYKYSAMAPGTYQFIMPEVESAASKADGVCLIITTPNNTLTTKAKTYNIAPGGISLDPVNIYALKLLNTQGGRMQAVSHGLVDDLTVDKSGNFQVDLFDGAELEVTVTVNPGYNLVDFSPSAQITDFAKTGNTITFAMPASDASVSAEYAAISGFLSKISADAASGEFDISGVIDGEAPVGSIITVNAKPYPGCKLVNGAPVSTVPVEFTKTGSFSWEFLMPGQDVVLSFASLTQLEVYKGGARQGVTNIVVADCDYYGASWRNNVELNADVEGRNNSPRAIRVFRPAAGQGNGLEGIENDDRAAIGFALTSAETLPLKANNVTALSLWIKAPRADITMEFIGFGEGANAMGMGNVSIGAVNTWKRFIIPVPAAESEKPITRKFFVKFDNLNQGEQILIDDIEFINYGTSATTVSDTISIPNAYPYDIPSEPVAIASILPVNQITRIPAVTYTVDGTSAVIRNANWGGIAVNLGNWGFSFPSVFEYIVSGAGFNAATNTITPSGLGADFTIQVKAGEAISNTMACKVVSSVFTGLVLENYSDTGPGNWITDHLNNDRKFWAAGIGVSESDRALGYEAREEGVAFEAQPMKGVIFGGFGIFEAATAGNSKSLMLTPKITGAKAGRQFTGGAKDISSYTTLSFWFKRLHSGDSYAIALYNGSSWTAADAETGTRFQAGFTPTAALNAFEKITLNLSGFKDAGGDVINLNAVTGWAVIVTDKQGANFPDDTGRIWIETVLVE